MRKNIRAVEITFENLDYVEIPIAYFASFSIKGSLAPEEQSGCNSVLRKNRAEFVAFELLRSVDTVLPDLEQDLFYDPLVDFSLLSRILERRDITEVILHNTEGTAEYYYIPWEDAEDEYHNKLQYAHINNNGNLSVTIQAL